MSSDNEVSSVSTKPARPPVERLAYRIDEVANSVGLSRRAIERARVAGRFPKADIKVGRCPLWRIETIKAWLEGGGK
jgi:predicted DNA-binding transcriptional regulator AlpA